MKTFSEIGTMVSEFVESRVLDKPSEDNFDLWLEKIYAALFSSSFELFLRLSYTYTASETEFNKELENFLNLIVEHSSKWVETRWEESQEPTYRGKIKIEFRDFILETLSIYFSVGINAITEKNFKIEIARSHSCFVVLSERILDFTKNGRFATKESVKSFFEDTMLTCDNLSKEIRERMRSRRK